MFVLIGQSQESLKKFKAAVRKFTTRSADEVAVKRTIIEADGAISSHIDGYENENHFVPEAQPNDRTKGDSTLSKDKIASNINPEQITEGTTAYEGSPIINSRGEVIQGNNRTDALQTMYENFPRTGKEIQGLSNC